MSAALSYERVRDQLQELKMEAALSALDPVLEGAQKAEKLSVEVLDELFDIELAARFERRVKTNLKLSGFLSFRCGFCSGTTSQSDTSSA